LTVITGHGCPIALQTLPNGKGTAGKCKGRVKPQKLLMPYYIDPTKPVGGIVLAVLILVVGLFLNSIFGPSIHKAFWDIWDRIFKLFPASYQEHVESVASLPMDRVIDFYIGYLTAHE
jgi:hypothetical protein